MTQKIKGYRDLSEDEIKLINLIKDLGVDCQGVIQNMNLVRRGTEGSEQPIEPDMRWVNIGRTHLQEGISALVRSIAKPTTF